MGIIIKSKIREIVKKLDEEHLINNVSEDVEDSLNNKVEDILKQAVKRAKSNQRRTLFARDL